MIDQTQNEVVTAWKKYSQGVVDWKKLADGIEPFKGGCGLIYELGNPLERNNEDCALADMTGINVAEPHYHPTDNWELYFILEGSGLVVTGKEEQAVKVGDAVIIPPATVHYTIPGTHGLVLLAVNTPPFSPENYIVIDPSVSDKVHEFSAPRFTQLTGLR